MVFVIASRAFFWLPDVKPRPLTQDLAMLKSRLVAVVAAFVFLLGPSLDCSGDDASIPTKEVLLIAGPPSHGYGAHEHYAGLKVLAESIEQSGVDVATKLVRGWPDDESLVEKADAVVIYCDGGGRHVAMEHRDALRKLLIRGGGLVCLHYAVEMLPGESGDEFVDLLGGHFEIHRSVNPHWSAAVTSLPEHPITRGVSPFTADDEWYFYMRFSEAGKLTPIIQSIAPEHTMRRADGHHSGNPDVRKSVAAGELQTLAWAFEPTIGGRSFGFTGGHNHWNWGHEPIRRLVTNAIIWSAGGDVPAEMTLAPLGVQQLVADQDEPAPAEFDVAKTAARYGVEATAPASEKSDSMAQEPAKAAINAGANVTPADSKLLAATTSITTQTSRHCEDLSVSLEDLGDGRDLFLVATDSGDGFSCDWADWINPTLTGPAGKLNLVDLDWVSATSGWGQPHKNANAAGDPVTVRGNDVSETAIGVHASSVVHFKIPDGYDTLTVTAALDTAGTSQNNGEATSVRFFVFAGSVPDDLAALDTRMSDGQRAAGNAVAGLEIADGLAVELMGSEPDLTSLTNLDVDHRGRVWVCDVMNYRTRNGARPEGDRILILEDTTGDGKLDLVKTFYQGRDIDSAMGICVLGNEVIVSASPWIWRFVDEDGDDIPDSKTAMFTETGQPQHDHSAHSFLFGPDGKLLWNFGNTGGQVKDAEGKTVVDIHGRPIVDNGKPLFGGMPFRCDLDGSNMEVLGHNFRNNWETTIDSFGTLWQSDNDDDGNRGTRINFVMEQGNYGYLDERTGENWWADRITLEDEIPLRHWHLNDPGVVPNVLQTGAGSPCGITVYEGRLLPRRFWDQVIHCEPGVNIVRAYPMHPDGAGYTATIEPLMRGVIDKWFRPADVCVAPDGSLFVTDWYDPGVGGHRQGDSDRGRLFRIAPPGVTYTTPKLDFETVQGCVDALRNPNRSAQYMAWRGLTKIAESSGDASIVEPLTEMTRDDNPRLRARAYWALANLTDQKRSAMESAMVQDDVDLRIMSIRLAKQIGEQVDTPVSELVGVLADDPSPSVRRELALAIRYDTSATMPAVWAKLAAQHDGVDRWYLEALGIGSDVRPAECFDAWMTAIDGDWNTAGGRDVVWRTRADAAADKLVELIADPALPLPETNRYFRALEYHTDDVRTRVLERLLTAH